MKERRSSPSGQDHGSAAVPRDERVRSVVQGFRVIFRSIQEHSRWVEKQCGVSAAQLWAMWELFATPGLRVSDLSKALSIHQSTASNMLDKLEQKGLIRRERRGPDQRVVQLFLTDAGVELVARAPRPAQGALTSALQKLPDQLLAEIDADLAELLKIMNIKDSKAALEPLSDD